VNLMKVLRSSKSSTKDNKKPHLVSGVYF
jgi:hypothetical protein